MLVFKGDFDRRSLRSHTPTENLNKRENVKTCIFREKFGFYFRISIESGHLLRYVMIANLANFVTFTRLYQMTERKLSFK
jgi:hypothetical protein